MATDDQEPEEDHPQGVPTPPPGFVSNSLQQITAQNGMETFLDRVALVKEAEAERQAALQIIGRHSKKRGRKGNPNRVGVKRDPKDWQEPFLASLRICPNVTLAASFALVSYHTIYRHRNEDPDFKMAWDDAIKQGVDLLHASAWARSVEGTHRPIFQGGVCVGHERQYSDRLTEVLLKAHLPHMFRENHAVAAKIEVTTAGKEKPGMTPQEVLDVTRQILPGLLDKARAAMGENAA